MRSARFRRGRFIAGVLYPAYETHVRRRAIIPHLRRLEASQWLPEERLRAEQWAALQALLRHAFETVPFYRAAFGELGASPEEIRSPADFEKLPVLDKRDIRDNRERLRSARFRPEELIARSTGGSTGEPLHFLLDRRSAEYRQAAALRGDAWAGGPLGRAEFHLWGEPLRRTTAFSRWKQRAWHGLRNQWFESGYWLGDDRLDELVRRFNGARPDLVVGYTNSLYVLARHAQRRGAALWSPRGIVATAEALSGQQREAIEAAFGAPVFNRYGCREVMLIAMECEAHAGMHVTADNLYVEVLRGGRPAAPGECGDVVVTDLYNYGMPLIRYRVGDLAVASDRRCPCGRGLPMVESVQGRTMDLIRLPDGSSVAGLVLSGVILKYPWIEEYQVEQAAPHRVDVRLRPAPGTSAEAVAAFATDLRRWLGGQVEVPVTVVDSIPPGASGKHRPVICLLEPAAEQPEGEVPVPAGR